MSGRELIDQWATTSSSLSWLAFKIDNAIAEAVAAERERCAQIANNPYSDAVGAFGYDEPFAVGDKIAAAIRARN